MIKEKTAGHTLELYDSIEELPIRRFRLFNKMLMIDAAVGSDMEAVNDRISRISRFIDTDTAKAKAELGNMQQTFYLIINEIGVKHKSLVALIHSIDGKKIGRLTDARIDEILERLSDEKVSWYNRLIESVKKKNRARARSLFSGRVQA